MFSSWGTPENLMFVVGATRPEYMNLVRKHAPNHFLLVPGVGAQGGSLKEISEVGWNDDCGLLINSSRSIIYASNKDDFAKCAGIEAFKMQAEMKEIGLKKGLF